MSESTHEPDSQVPERGLISDDELPEDLQPDDSSASFDEERGGELIRSERDEATPEDSPQP